MENLNKTSSLTSSAVSNVASNATRDVTDNGTTNTPTNVANAATRKHWPTWLRRQRLEMLACCVIALGLFMLLQPFALALYTWSFVVMLAGTVMFMIVSKFPN